MNLSDLTPFAFPKEMIMFKNLMTKLFAQSQRHNRVRTSTRRPCLESLEERYALSALFDTSQWASWVTSPDMKVLAGDFNGDGRTDVMKFDVGAKQAPGGLWVGLSSYEALQLGNLNTTQWTVGQPDYSGTIPISGGTDVYRNLTVTGLPPGLRATLAGDKIAISGTPTRVGTFNSIHVSVQDSRGITVSRTYSLTINLALTPALPGATAGQSYSATISATGGSGNYRFALTSGSLPRGLSLSDSGLLSGTTTTAGTFGFTVRATDTVADAFTSRAYTLTVNPGAVSSFVLASSTTSTITGNSFSITITAQDRYGNTASYNGALMLTSSNSQVVSSLSVTLTNGQGTATLTANHSGTVTLSATGSSLQSNSVTITVDPSLYLYTATFYAYDRAGRLLESFRWEDIASNDAQYLVDHANALQVWYRAVVNYYGDAAYTIGSTGLQSKTAYN